MKIGKHVTPSAHCHRLLTTDHRMGERAVTSTPVDSIERFFRERNRAWITNDTQPLQSFSHKLSAAPWLHHLSRGFAAKQHEMHMRRKRLLKVHSQLQIQSLTVQDGGVERAAIEEVIHFIYRDGPEYNVESRLIRHLQDWLPTPKGYELVGAEESREARIQDDGQPRQRHSQYSVAASNDAAELSPYPDYLRVCKTYDRVRCQRYADLWWRSHNPAFVFFTYDDCTGFASQCLYAANVPMTGGPPNRTEGWWYKGATQQHQANWSYSWSTSNALHLYLTTQLGAVVESSARSLQIGDLVFYDWDGSGRFGHTTVVTDIDASGDPLVNAHTVPSYHRHYQYLDSPAWTADTRYSYVHIPKTVCQT